MGGKEMPDMGQKRITRESVMSGLPDITEEALIFQETVGIVN